MPTRKVKPFLIAWMFVLFLLAGCRPVRPPGSPVLIKRSMSYGGRERTYQVWEPTSAETEGRIPLVLLLHGGGGSGEQVCRQPGTVASAAHAAGALVVCPDGVDGHWNDGRAITNYVAHAQDVDDVGYLLALADRLQKAYPADAENLMVSGASNGGMMSLRMGCDASERVVAVAAVIANLPANLDCQPRHGVRVLLMNGTEDPLMPWAGGQVRFLRRQLGEVLSTTETAVFWATANGCEGKPVTQELADLDPTDGTRVRMERFQGCRPGGQVVLYSVEGGGHTLPGGEQYAPPWLIGRVSHDLDGGQAVWDFFAGIG